MRTSGLKNLLYNIFRLKTTPPTDSHGYFMVKPTFKRCNSRQNLPNERIFGISKNGLRGMPACLSACLPACLPDHVRKASAYTTKRAATILCTILRLTGGMCLLSYRSRYTRCAIVFPSSRLMYRPSPFLRRRC